MRRWEYVDLSKLLGSSDPVPDEASLVIEGQQLRMEVPQRNQRRQIKDILTWLEAYSRFMAVMLSAHGTSKEEAAGLAAHIHLILQLSRDYRLEPIMLKNLPIIFFLPELPKNFTHYS